MLFRSAWQEHRQISVADSGAKHTKNLPYYIAGQKALSNHFGSGQKKRLTDVHEGRAAGAMGRQERGASARLEQGGAIALKSTKSPVRAALPWWRTRPSITKAASAGPVVIFVGVMPLNICRDGQHRRRLCPSRPVLLFYVPRPDIL